MVTAIDCDLRIYNLKSGEDIVLDSGSVYNEES